MKFLRQSCFLVASALALFWMSSPAVGAVSASQLDKWLDEMTGKAAVANGHAEVDSYDPKTFSLAKAKASAKRAMEGWKHHGVHFNVTTGSAEVLKVWREKIEDLLGSEADGVDQLFEKLVALGVVQDAVAYYLGDIDEGVSYWSIPYRFEIYVKYPDGKGKIVHILYELGD